MANLNNIVQANNIRVVNLLQDKNLRHETLLQLLVEPSGGDLLYGHLGSMDTVPPMPHHRERPGPYLPSDDVVSDQTASTRRLSHRR